MSSISKSDTDLLHKLLNGINDHEECVRAAVLKALIEIGAKHPYQVLRVIRDFLDGSENPKASIQSSLYNAARNIIENLQESVGNEEIILSWIKTSANLQMSSMISSDLQQSASDFLTASASNFYLKDVMESLLSLMKADEPPPRNIIEIFSSIVISCSRDCAIYFNPIIDKILPNLSAINIDTLKLSISCMCAKFSDAVVDSIANASPKKENFLKLDQYCDNCYTIFDILLNQWLKTSSVEVKNEIIICLGNMSYLLSKEGLESYIPITIYTIISLYKRNQTPFPLTLSLALIFDATIKSDCQSSLSVHLDLVLNTLFSQVCVSPNFKEPTTVKNHCEVLRCFELLSKTFSESVVTFLIQRLENASHMHKVGSLSVIKHLINSKCIDEDQISKIVNVLYFSINDPNSKVVKTLAEVIVALCHSGSLKSNTGITFIDFLVKHSSGSHLEAHKRETLNELGQEYVGSVCCKALNHLSTSVTHAVPLLWPHILQYVASIEHQASYPTVLSCLAALFQNQESEILKIKSTNFAESGPLSLPYLIVHLFVMSCSTNAKIGLPALTILQFLPNFLSPKIVQLWEENLPRLKETYSQISNDISSPSSLQVWQDSLRDFFGCSLESLDSENIVCGFISAELELIVAWEKDYMSKCFLLSLFGVSLCHCFNNGLIESTLRSLFSITNHKVMKEQECFSLCLGLCSKRHIALVMNQIETWLKEIDWSKRYGLSFLSLIKSQDVKLEEAMNKKETLIQSLGYIASLAPSDVLGSYVDGPIMLHLLNAINSNKCEQINETTLQTLSKIAKALLTLDRFELRQRPILITHVVNTAKQDNVSCSSLTWALQVLRDLSALKPELNIEERTIILQVSLTSTFDLLRKLEGPDVYMERCYSQLNVLIRTIIQNDPSVATLDDVTTLLHKWTLARSEILRAKALDLLLSSYGTFLQHAVISHMTPQSFNQTSQLVAMLSARFSDPSVEVRGLSVSCFGLILKILSRYSGHGPLYCEDEMLWLKKIEHQIKTAATEEGLRNGVLIISKVICNKLSFAQLHVYLTIVVSGLSDATVEGAIGVARILSEIFKLRGHQLHQYISELLDKIYDRLAKLDDLKVIDATVDAIVELSQHNLIAILEVISNYPLPYTDGLCKTLRKIAQNKELCSTSLNHFIQILERSQFFSEHETASNESVRVATLPTLTAMCCVKEILKGLDNIKNDTNLIVDKISCNKDLANQSENQTHDSISNQECKNLDVHNGEALSPKSKTNQNDKQSLLKKAYSEEKNIHQTAYFQKESNSSNFAPNSSNFEPYFQIVNERFSSLVALLMMGYGSYVGTEVPIHQSSNEKKSSYVPNRNATGIIPSRVALECIEVLSSVHGLKKLKETINKEILNVNYRDSGEDFSQNLSSISLLLAEEAPNHISSLVAYLDTHHDHEIQRMTVAVIFGQLASSGCSGDKDLLEMVSSGLLSKLNDRSWQVRRLVVKGIANFATLRKNEIEYKMSEVVSALVGATDLRGVGESYAECQVALESLRGLNTLIPILDTELLNQHSSTLLIRARHFIENTNGEVREAAAGVLRGLSRSIGHTEEFKDQIHLYCLSLVVHLKDSHPPMVVMCKSALRALSSHMNEEMTHYFGKALQCNESLDYKKFLEKFSDLLINWDSEKIGLYLEIAASYFLQTEARLREASILLAGYLVTNSYKYDISSSLPRVYQGINYLLKDNDKNVRASTILTISLVAKNINL